jgi:succinate dehydrogenase / fumarate reductase cytochrome b subunit
MRTFWTSSVGQKVLMAVTGVALFLFVVVHMIGNLQIFLGPDAINQYAVFLKSLGKLLWVARSGLLLLFVVHVYVAFRLTHENQKARPDNYVVKRRIKSSWPSSYMGVLGSFILFYLIFHLFHFTIHIVDPSYSNLLDAAGRHDVYSMVVMGFQDVPVAIGYIVAMIVLGAHLWHGIPSFFQSLGFNHSVLTPCIEKASPFIAIIITAGYLAVPVSVLLGLVTLPTGGM